MITKIAAKKREIHQCYLNDRREHAETYEKDNVRGLSEKVQEVGEKITQAHCVT